MATPHLELAATQWRELAAAALAHWHLDFTSPVSAYQYNRLTRRPLGGTLLDMT